MTRAPRALARMQTTSIVSSRPLYSHSTSPVDRRGGPRDGPPHPPDVRSAPAEPWRSSTPHRLQSEGGEARGGGHAVGGPAAKIVVGIEHLAQLGGWTVHAGRWPLGNRLVHHAPRQRVVRATH